MLEALCELDNQLYQSETFAKTQDFKKKRRHMVCKNCMCKLIFRNEGYLSNGTIKKAHFAGQHTLPICNPSKNTQTPKKINKKVVTIKPRSLLDDDDEGLNTINSPWERDNKLNTLNPDELKNFQFQSSNLSLSTIAKYLKNLDIANRMAFLDKEYRIGKIRQNGIELFREHDEVTEKDINQQKVVYGVIQEVGFTKIEETNPINGFSSIWLNFTTNHSDYALLITEEYLAPFLKDTKLENKSKIEVKRSLEQCFVLAIVEITKPKKNGKKRLYSICKKLE